MNIEGVIISLGWTTTIWFCSNIITKITPDNTDTCIAKKKWRHTHTHTSIHIQCDAMRHVPFLIPTNVDQTYILFASECVTNGVADRRFKWKRASLLALTDVILKRISMLLSCRGQHKNLKRIQYLPYRGNVQYNTSNDRIYMNCVLFFL